MKDLGRVEDTSGERTSWNILHNKEVVVLSVQRQFGANTLEVIDAVKAKIDEIRPTLPPGTVIQTIRDNSIYIRASITALEEHLVFGSLLAALVVMLFIRNWRSVVIEIGRAHV